MSQFELAAEQLEDAIALFLDKQSYASATTLAAAAEGIFGEALKSHNTENVLEWQWKMSEATFKLFQEESQTQRTFNDEQNLARNILKHYFDQPIDVDMQEAAVKMIIRANENADRLNVTIDRISEFESWFLINVVG